MNRLVLGPALDEHSKSSRLTLVRTSIYGDQKAWLVIAAKCYARTFSELKADKI